MEKRIISLIGCFLFLNACKSIVIGDLHTTMNRTPIDVSLTPQIDELALATAFSGITGSSNIFTGISLSLDPRILDTKTIFERTNTSWFTNQTNPQGTIILKIPFSETHYGKGLGYIFLNAFTACIPALCGVPIAISKTTMEVEVIIKNKEGKLITQYTAEGKAMAKRAFYIGYTRNDASRKINIQALNEALQKIAIQIHQDSLKIVNGLR